MDEHTGDVHNKFVTVLCILVVTRSFGDSSLSMIHGVYCNGQTLVLRSWVPRFLPMFVVLISFPLLPTDVRVLLLQIKSPYFTGRLADQGVQLVACSALRETLGLDNLHLWHVLFGNFEELTRRGRNIPMQL